jgi:bacteriocin-like protein
MKKLSIKELETTTGGRLRTCFIGGGLTVIGIGIGFGSSGFWGAGAALIAGLAAANYNGCL